MFLFCSFIFFDHSSKGKWHKSGQCRSLSCFLRLKGKSDRSHWSCCYSFAQNGRCLVSYHEEEERGEKEEKEEEKEEDKEEDNEEDKEEDNEEDKEEDNEEDKEETVERVSPKK